MPGPRGVEKRPVSGGRIPNSDFFVREATGRVVTVCPYARSSHARTCIYGAELDLCRYGGNDRAAAASSTDPTDLFFRLFVPTCWGLTAIAAVSLNNKDRRWRPPRTDERPALHNYWGARPHSTAAIWRDLMSQPVAVCQIVLLAALAVHLPKIPGQTMIAIIAGGVITWAVGYAWWRTSETFMTYVVIGGALIEEDTVQASAKARDHAK